MVTVSASAVPVVVEVIGMVVVMVVFSVAGLLQPPNQPHWRQVVVVVVKVSVVTGPDDVVVSSWKTRLASFLMGEPRGEEDEANVPSSPTSRGYGKS